MDELEDSVAHYVSLLGTPSSEDAFLGLLHLGPRALPHLTSAFLCESRPEVRATLVEVIWQTRSPEVITFLAQALEDPDPAVWKEALDGLVSIGGPQSIAVNQCARANSSTNAAKYELLGWLDEALEQLGVSPRS